MDFSFTEEQNSFRRELQAFLEEEIRKASFERGIDGWSEGVSRDFSRKVGERGWIGLTWPREYGGQGRSYLDRLIYTEEMLRYGAPVGAHWLGERQVGPAILRYGTEEQKRYFLPRIIKGELVFALGMSEPEAGSDLASLQTRAIEQGEEFVIQGQKVWTSQAHAADYIYLVARTDPQAPKHKGISEFLIDTRLSGINIRPLIDMTGSHHYNEVFFDGVRVPKTALVGEKNRGWYQIASQLDYERAGIERLMGNYILLQDITRFASEKKRGGKPLSRDPLIRAKLVNLAIEFEIGRLLIYRVTWMLSQGVLPNYETAMAKAFATAFEQRLANVATLVQGLYAQLMPGSSRALFKGLVARSYLYCPAYSIQGGTSEILRNIVATRGLGLASG